MEIPGAAPLPGTTFGRDLGRNATQIRQSGGFILARSQDPGPNSAPILQPCAFRGHVPTWAQFRPDKPSRRLL